MFGPLPLLPLALLVVLVVGVGVVVVLVQSLLSSAVPFVPMAVAGLVLGAVAWLGIEAVARARRRRNATGWCLDLEAAARNPQVSREQVGGKAYGLVRIRRLGIPVAGGLVLTQRLGEQIAAARGTGGAVLDAMPRAARRELRQFLRRADDAIVIRPSFTSEDGSLSFAGVFSSARAPSSSLVQVATTLSRVLASADGDAAREYRRRHRHTSAMGHALLLQDALDADVMGTAASRGIDGRTDVVTIDWCRRRSPVRTVSYDLLADSVEAVGMDGPAVETAPWMRHLAVVALLVEREMQGAVHLEFAITAGQLVFLQARRVRCPERMTLTCQIPFDRGMERRPALFHDIRGGIENQRNGMLAAFGRIGLVSDMKEAEIRYVDGAPYVDLEVMRRVLAEIGRALLVRPRAGVAWRLIAPIQRARLPAVIDTTEVSREGWRGVKEWHARVVLPMARRHVEVATVGALARMAHRLVRQPGTPERSAHPLLVALLAAQRRRCDAEALRIEAFLSASERAIGDYARALLARGVLAWEQMFSGDRHLHLGLSMIDQWIEGDERTRTALDAKWRERRTALAEREDRPAPPRVHHPPIRKPRDTTDRLHAVGLVGGVASGVAVPVGPNARGTGAPGSIAVLADGANHAVSHTLSSAGIVVTGGGSLSSAATVAAELKIPAVYCPNARPGSIAGRPVSIDGDLGVIEVS